MTSAGCGSTKSCYRRPAACTGSTDCDYFYSQRPVGNNLVEIELVAKSDGWVAVGYSDDKSMVRLGDMLKECWFCNDNAAPSLNFGLSHLLPSDCNCCCDCCVAL